MQNDVEDPGYSCGIDMRNAMMDVDTRNPILHFGVPMSWPSSSMKQSYLKRETCAYVMMNEMIVADSVSRRMAGEGQRRPLKY